MKTKMGEVLHELKHRRIVRTQGEMAASLGYNVAYFSQLINGSEPINDKFIQKIQTTYKVNPNFWNSDKAPMFTEPNPQHLRG